jgi:hypothetical protein
MPSNADEFARKLRDMAARVEGVAQRASAYDGKTVPYSEILTDGFMARRTRFPTMRAMFDAHPPMAAAVAEDKRAILDTPEWSAHVAAGSDFSSWRELFHTATHEWTSRNICNPPDAPPASEPDR